jgi:hypothetical protein
MRRQTCDSRKRLRAREAEVFDGHGGWFGRRSVRWDSNGDALYVLGGNFLFPPPSPENEYIIAEGGAIIGFYNPATALDS